MIKRLDILKKIGEHLSQIKQWTRYNSYGHCAAYHAKAEGLIEILEIDDCGSTGGYDLNQPRAFNIFDRWVWLYKKHNCPTEYKNYKQIEEFFNEKC